MGAESAGMHDSFGNPLMIEMLDLLEEVMVLQQRRSAFACAGRGFVIGDNCARLSCQRRMLLSGYLVEFAALSLCLLLAANFTPLGFTPLRLAASFHLVSHFHGCYEMVALTATTCELQNGEL